MRGLERHLIEGEVAKVREHLRLRLAIEIAPARARVLGWGGGSHEHDTGPLQGIAHLALVDHKRDARVGENVLGVHGKARDQQQRCTVRCGRDIDQRAIGIARAGHQGGQCPRAALAQKLLGGGYGVEIWGGLHLDSPLKGVTKRPPPEPWPALRARPQPARPRRSDRVEQRSSRTAVRCRAERGQQDSRPIGFLSPAWPYSLAAMKSTAFDSDCICLTILPTSSFGSFDATASPSMMQEREPKRASASTISGNRWVRSLPGRL